jgi:UPF0148 protein
MPMRKEDEIMAEYLLKGGKMLDKSCKTCGCPLFEDNDSATPHGYECTCSTAEPSQECLMLAEALAGTIHSLCERIRTEHDPDNILTLMSAVKTGAESLRILCQL